MVDDRRGSRDSSAAADRTSIVVIDVLDACAVVRELGAYELAGVVRCGGERE